ncbi:hypothetical protein BAE30_00385 [Acidithiobacillus caldus]|uniref:Uncharacterized protein n=1 Tax=Acidithiobacillus caldus TaxID=33059 RepID=A0A1E7Z4J6_9PROT|nr:hypothetical protein BAE30_00385 [Acidithiobacillus caldus]
MPNGIGITDFQKIFSVAESGWNEEIQETEKPYGMGFLSCLFAAKHVTIASHTQQVFFQTESALSFSEIPVEDLQRSDPRTLVQLDGVKNIPTAVEIKNMVMGFPIPVFLNGVELPRPHSLEEMGFRKMETGLVFQGDIRNLAGAYYLQGLPIRTGLPNYTFFNSWVVHLDPTQFHGRIPDRESLIDWETSRDKLMDTIHRMVVETLTRLASQALKKGIQGQLEFLRSYGSEMLHYPNLRPLLNEFSVLPPQVVDGTLNIIAFDRDAEIMDTRQVTKGDVETGIIKVADSDVIESEDTKYMPLKALLSKLDIVLVSPHRLDSEHWIFEHLIESIDEKVSVVNPSESVQIALTYEHLYIVLCDSVEIQAKCKTQSRKFTLSASVTDFPVYIPDCGLCIPAKSSGDFGAQQVFSYRVDSDEIDESAMDEDNHLLTRHVTAMRNNDPAKLLASILSSDARLRDYPLLAGKKFTVTIQDNG